MKPDYNKLAIGDTITLKGDKIPWKVTDLKTGIDQDSGEKYWDLTLSNGVTNGYYLWLIESSEKITGIYTTTPVYPERIAVAYGSFPWAMQMLIEGKRVRKSDMKPGYYMKLSKNNTCILFNFHNDELAQVRFDELNSLNEWELAE